MKTCVMAAVLKCTEVLKAHGTAHHKRLEKVWVNQVGKTHGFRCHRIPIKTFMDINTPHMELKSREFS